MSGASLIEVHQLKDLLDTTSPPLLFDCRFDLVDSEAGYQSYLEGHIPGAIYVHSDKDLAAAKNGRNGRHPLPSMSKWEQTYANLGITPDRPVVIYDNQGGMYAARLWWMLQATGHTHVSILNGGFGAWKNLGLPVSQSETLRQPVALTSLDVLTLLAATLDVTFRSLITLPLKLKFTALTLLPLTLPMALMLPDVVLPVALTMVAFSVPALILANAVMFKAVLILLKTLPLKLNPAAFKLPPVMLADTLTTLPVTLVTEMLPPDILPVPETMPVPNSKLPPVILPVADTTPPALTSAKLTTLPPVILPVILAVIELPIPVRTFLRAIAASSISSCLSIIVSAAGPWK